MNRLHVTGIDGLSKLISSLTDKQNYYTFHIWTDLEQAYKKESERGYTIEIADIEDGERFELYKE